MQNGPKPSRTPVFTDSVKQISKFLAQTRSKNAARAFQKELRSKISAISGFPDIDLISNRFEYVRSFPVGKKWKLNYEYDQFSLALLEIIDDRQDPSKNKFESDL